MENIIVAKSIFLGAGNALQTIESRQKGDVLVTIPVHMLVTDETARADSLVQQHVMSFDFSIDSCLILTLYIMIEKLISQKNSKWINFFQTLPSINHNFNLPQFEWHAAGQEAQEALEVLFTAPSIAAKMREGAHIHELTLRKLNTTVFASLKRSYSHLTDVEILKTFLWAGSIVLTRSWSDAGGSIPGNCTMVPILDLLNHEDDAMGMFAMAFDDNPIVQAVGVVASKNIAAGSELVASYDPSFDPFHVPMEDDNGIPNKCMQDMLLGFGFLPLHSGRPWCFDVDFVISTVIFQDATLETLRNDLLMQAGTGPGRQYATKLKENNGNIPSALLAVLRLSISGEREMMLIQKRGSADAPFDLATERQVLLLLKNTMVKAMSTIPSAEDQDQERMVAAREEGNDKMAIALEVRIHERRICEQTLEHVKKLWLRVMVDDKLWED